MSVGQERLVKWSIPAFALILGLLWYKRRRADRVDPGGLAKSKSADESSSVRKKKKDAAAPPTPGRTASPSNCDSGIHTDDSRFDTSTPTPIEDTISPRKVSESLDIPNRKPSSITMSLLSNTPWYDDVEPDTPEMREIQLGSNPGKSGFELMSKSSNRSAEFKAKAVIMEDVIEEGGPTKIVVANKHAVEVKAEEFKISPSSNSGKSLDDQQDKSQRQALSDRDSANHSPVSGVLEGSVNDEARSEGSTDSGKGGSIHGMNANRAIYEFAVPIKLVGKLIGKGGRFLQRIKNHSGVYGIVIKHYSPSRDMKICCIDGTPDSIQSALEMIRENFPEKTYPHFTLEQIAYEDLISPEMPWTPENMYLSLVEGVNNDVIISNIVKPNHFFIQLPTHPTFPLLPELVQKMTYHYESVDSPMIPDELQRGMIMVAKWCDKWVRVVVEEPDLTGEATLVRVVDYGGFYTFSHSEMRKIKYDFLTLPFQALEVFLANVQSKEEWSEDAYTVVSRICSNVVGQAQIEAFVDSSTFISLYFELHKYGVISLADELTARGLAEPTSFGEVAPLETFPPV